ncbi:hypothetical protein R3P38DRAFT_3483617 [Favolaschia claudopus]|uniref:Uncharacterized protein n=1 Tax=Favolaschia claudopus TaxID=2862362 RepID=A0AAW0CCQ2_9AGAR
MSIKSLSAFAKHCPCLDGLALTIFDTRDVPLVVDHTLNSQLPLARLDVGVSQLQPENILKVTDFLTKLFPNLIDVSVFDEMMWEGFEDVGEQNLPAYLANPEAYRRFQAWRQVREELESAHPSSPASGFDTSDPIAAMLQSFLSSRPQGQSLPLHLLQ